MERQMLLIWRKFYVEDKTEIILFESKKTHFKSQKYLSFVFHSLTFSIFNCGYECSEKK